jgi:hypothetical protein
MDPGRSAGARRRRNVARPTRGVRPARGCADGWRRGEPVEPGWSIPARCRALLVAGRSTADRFSMARCGQRRYADSETDVWCASGCSAATMQTNRSVKRCSLQYLSGAMRPQITGPSVPASSLSNACASRISPFTVEFGDSARIARTSAGPSVATEQPLQGAAHRRPAQPDPVGRARDVSLLRQGHQRRQRIEVDLIDMRCAHAQNANDSSHK